MFTIIIGTRPEAIKLAPLISLFKNNKNFKTRVVLTGQHRELVKQVMDLFDLKEDINLNLMLVKQSLNYIISESLKQLKIEFSKNKPDLVFVQGDTNTAFAAALAAFYQEIPVAHIEAGLRTNDLFNPYPEEGNRRLISQIAKLHFAPTEIAKKNLLDSGVKENIEVTGNTVIDALLHVSKKKNLNYFDEIDWQNNKVILTTIHRRENWGKVLISIIKGLRKILNRHSDVFILLPLHPNPVVREPLQEYLGKHPRVLLTEPLAYDEIVYALKNCKIVLTDSGGLQEEAPALGKPVLVIRKATERIEAVKAGTAKVIGTNSQNIFDETNNLLLSQSVYEKMSKAINPYGDGTASEKILKVSLAFLNSLK